MEFSAASDPGLVRSRNEDSFTLLPRPRGALLAVADGVGGSKAGEVASEIATRTFTELLSNLADEERPDSRRLRSALEAANDRIIAAAKQRAKEQAGMGTTMTSAWLEGGLLAFAHVGDSRLYVYREGAFTCLTHDHSVAGELVRQGTIPPEDAKSHPQRHVLTRALGMSPFTCDEGDARILSGDVVLLCTDGLVSAISEAEIAREIGEGFAGVALRLIDAANRAGGPDNTTVVAVRLGPEDFPRGDAP